MKHNTKCSIIIMCWCERLTVYVLEKVGEIEELRNEFLHVSPCVVDGAPGAGDGEKLPVSVVEPGGGGGGGGGRE